MTTISLTNLSTRIDARRAALHQADQSGDDDGFLAHYLSLLDLYQAYFEARRRGPAPAAASAIRDIMTVTD